LALRHIEAGGGRAGVGAAKALVRQQRWTVDSPVAKLMDALVHAAPEAVRFESDGEDRIVVAVEGGSGGELILTDSFYPGWRAWVDGEPVSIRRADEAFRGVPVPPGTHTVEFRYEPASFRVGLFLSLLTLAALTAAAATVHLLGRSSASATAARS